MAALLPGLVGFPRTATLGQVLVPNRLGFLPPGSPASFEALGGAFEFRLVTGGQFLQGLDVGAVFLPPLPSGCFVLFPQLFAFTPLGAVGGAFTPVAGFGAVGKYCPQSFDLLLVLGADVAVELSAGGAQYGFDLRFPVGFEFGAQGVFIHGFPGSPAVLLFRLQLVALLGRQYREAGLVAFFHDGTGLFAVSFPAFAVGAQFFEFGPGVFANGLDLGLLLRRQFQFAKQFSAAALGEGGDRHQ